jgi:arylsulfatase A-like enzyme
MDSSQRNKFINLLLLTAGLTGSWTQNTSASNNKTNALNHKIKPNVIYILTDDIGYGDVKCFNPDGKIPTPNIDAMAANGIMFTDAHSSSAVCTPTRYGILTGRYNWRTSLKSFVLSGYSKSLIKPDRTTIAGMLKQQGYTTGYIGKWHLGWDWDIEKKDSTLIKNDKNDGEKVDSALNLDELSSIPTVNFNTPIKNGPSSHGFDYSFGFCGSLDMPPYVYVENDVPTMVPSKSSVSVDDKAFWREGPTAEDFVHAKVLQKLTDKALAFINKSAKRESPFFLYLPLSAPHTPILPTTEFLGKSNTNMYGDFVMEVDNVVRQIREVIKSNGIAENTLVVFTSDNGCSPKANFEELAKVKHDPSYLFRGTKADIYEGGHHVPFIIEWPKGAAKNKMVSNTICTTDFFATCAEITSYKIKDNEGEDSYSLVPLLKGETIEKFRDYTVHHSVNGSFAIRQGDWKLCFLPGSGGWSYPTPETIKKEKLHLPAMQLFNLKEDIGETKNLIAKNPEKVAELKAALKKIILDGRSTPGKTQKNEGTDDWWQVESIVN